MEVILAVITDYEFLLSNENSSLSVVATVKSSDES